MRRKLQSLFIKKYRSGGFITDFRMMGRWKPVIDVYEDLFNSLKERKENAKKN